MELGASTQTHTQATVATIRLRTTQELAHTHTNTHTQALTPQYPQTETAGFVALSRVTERETRTDAAVGATVRSVCGRAYVAYRSDTDGRSAQTTGRLLLVLLLLLDARWPFVRIRRVFVVCVCVCTRAHERLLTRCCHALSGKSRGPLIGPSGVATATAHTIQRHHHLCPRTTAQHQCGPRACVSHEHKCCACARALALSRERARALPL